VRLNKIFDIFDLVAVIIWVSLILHSLHIMEIRQNQAKIAKPNLQGAAKLFNHTGRNFKTGKGQSRRKVMTQSYGSKAERP
jgi:hypothetical protein